MAAPSIDIKNGTVDDCNKNAYLDLSNDETSSYPKNIAAKACPKFLGVIMMRPPTVIEAPVQVLQQHSDESKSPDNQSPQSDQAKGDKSEERVTKTSCRYQPLSDEDEFPSEVVHASDTWANILDPTTSNKDAWANVPDLPTSNAWDQPTSNAWDNTTQERVPTTEDDATQEQASNDQDDAAASQASDDQAVDDTHNSNDQDDAAASQAPDDQVVDVAPASNDQGDAAASQAPDDQAVDDTHNSDDQDDAAASQAPDDQAVDDTHNSDDQDDAAASQAPDDHVVDVAPASNDQGDAAAHDQNLSESAQRPAPDPLERFENVDLMQAIPSNIDPVNDVLCLGWMPTKREDRKKPKKITLPDGISAYERNEIYEAEASHRQQAKKTQIAIDDGTHVPKVHVEFLSGKENSDYYAYVRVSVTFKWEINKHDHQSSVAFYLSQDNTEDVPAKPKAEAPSQVEDSSQAGSSSQAEAQPKSGVSAKPSFKSRGKTKDKEDVLSELEKAGELVKVSCTEETRKAAPFDALGDQVFPLNVSYHHLKLMYNPGQDHVHAFNAVTSRDFGPWNDTVQKLRSYLVHGARIDIAIQDAENLPSVIKNLNEELKSQQKNDTYQKWWSGKSRKIHYGHKDLRSREDAPMILLRSRISYRHLGEFMTMEMSGVTRDYEWQVKLSSKPRKGYAARFISIPGQTNVNALLMFVQNEENRPLGLEDGDSVEVRIHALNPYDVPSANWVGTVQASYPGAAIEDVGFLIHRRYDAKSKEWQGEDVKALGPLGCLDQIGGETTLGKLINASEPHAVDITYLADQKVYKRQIGNLRAIKELISAEKATGGISVTEDVVLANRFDRLPSLNFLEGWKPEEVTALYDAVDPAQQPIIDAIQNLPAGMLLVQGVPGADKTYTFGVILSHALKREVKQCGEKNRPGLKALIATPINANAEKIAEEIRSQFRTITDSAIVIRKYAKTTDKGIFVEKITQLAFEDKPRALDIEEMIENLSKAEGPAQQLGQDISRRQHREFHGDKRVTAIGRAHSVSDYIALALELKDRTDISPHVLAIERVKIAIGEDLIKDGRSAWHAVMNHGKQADSATKKRLSEILRDMVVCVLNASDAVVTTTQQASDPGLYLGFKPPILILDEAAKTPSVEAFSFAWYPASRFKFLVGDVRQSRPQIRSPPAFNGTATQIELSLFSRLIVAGFANVVLKKQFRYGPMLCQMLSDIFYKPEGLETSEKVYQDTSRDKIGQMYDVFDRLSRDPPNPEVILICLPKTKEELSPITKSKFNKETAIATWHVIAELHEIGYDPSDIGIITPYVAQRTIHENISAARMIVGGKNKMFDPDHQEPEDTESTGTQVKVEAQPSATVSPSTQDEIARMVGSFFLALLLAKEGVSSDDRTQGEVEAQPEEQEFWLPDYMIETSQRAQGNQRKILIFDLPTALKLGFVGDAHRLCTALSRAQHCLIIVADYEAIKLIKGFNQKAIGKVLEWVKKNGVTRMVPAINPGDPLYQLMPTTANRDPVELKDIQKEAAPKVVFKTDTSMFPILSANVPAEDSSKNRSSITKGKSKASDAEHHAESQEDSKSPMPEEIDENSDPDGNDTDHSSEDFSDDEFDLD